MPRRPGVNMGKITPPSSVAGTKDDYGTANSAAGSALSDDEESMPTAQAMLDQLMQSEKFDPDNRSHMRIWLRATGKQQASASFSGKSPPPDQPQSFVLDRSRRTDTPYHMDEVAAQPVANTTARRSGTMPPSTGATHPTSPTAAPVQPVQPARQTRRGNSYGPVKAHENSRVIRGNVYSKGTDMSNLREHDYGELSTFGLAQDIDGDVDANGATEFFGINYNS